jgi:hypothetical protein
VAFGVIFGSGDCPTGSRTHGEGKALNERNPASPTIACSRHGTVRKFRLHAGGFEERQTPNSATRWRLGFVVVPDKVRETAAKCPRTPTTPTTILSPLTSHQSRRSRRCPISGYWLLAIGYGYDRNVVASFLLQPVLVAGIMEARCRIV